MKTQISILSKLLLYLLLIYMLMRIAFSFYNTNTLVITPAIWLKIFLHGLHVDFAAVFYINIPFLIFYFLVVPLVASKYKIRFILLFYLICNLPFIAINLIDIIYYRFNHRRSTTDLFHSLSQSTHSFTGLFFRYWWMVMAFILLSIALYFIAAKTLKPVKTLPPGQWLHQAIIFLFCIGISGLISRGNTNRPLTPATALLYVNPEWQPLVNNSTFNILYSAFRKYSHIKRKDYFSSSTADSIFPVIKQYRHTDTFSRKNVVVFVLESFSEHNFIPGKSRAAMPFLDSLRSRSIVAKYTFQNGFESVQGMPALLTSLPPFTDEPLYISNYANIPFWGIGSILQEEHYSTNFFLGAEYDHFNFAKLCSMVGIEHYFSKDTFNDNTKDDQSWGIYDGYFFPFFARVTDTIREPFFNVLYNISSHPPFNVPEKYKEVFNSSSKQLNALSYVDMCFKNLFTEISTKKWFNNTIFIFIADHSLFDDSFNKPWQYYKNLQIPFFIYDPAKPEAHIITNICQQLDLVPTILDKLKYDKPFISFGNSIFQDTGRFSISALGAYQLIDSSGITGFDEQTNRLLYYYNWRTDPDLIVNDTTNPAAQKPLAVIKATLQQFNNSLIDNSFQKK